MVEPDDVQRVNTPTFGNFVKVVGRETVNVDRCGRGTDETPRDDTFASVRTHRNEPQCDSTDTSNTVGDLQPDCLPGLDGRGDDEFADGGHTRCSMPSCQEKNANTSAPSAIRILAGLPTP